jgi:hypothetical protein
MATWGGNQGKDEGPCLIHPVSGWDAERGSSPAGVAAPHTSDLITEPQHAADPPSDAVGGSVAL